MATVMVVGANGFIGSSVVAELRKEHKVIALFRNKVMRFNGCSHFTYAFDDRDSIKRLMMFLKPDFIIYLAGLQDLMECHKHAPLADVANALGPVVFSDEAQTVSHRFIYVSSAYVFNGLKGSYNESDLAMPDTVLGKTKLSGENYIRSKSSSYTILRCSPIFGLGSYDHPSLVDKMRMSLSKGQRFEFPENEYHSFLYIGVLLEILKWVMNNETTNEIYHVGGLTKVSSFEFGLDMAAKLGLDKSLLQSNKGHFPDSNFVDFSLNSTKVINNSKINTLVLEEGLDLFKQLLVR